MSLSSRDSAPESKQNKNTKYLPFRSPTFFFLSKYLQRRLISNLISLLKYQPLFDFYSLRFPRFLLHSFSLLLGAHHSSHHTFYLVSFDLRF
ncbi:hypothetical protein SLE2022_060570 [Rubroshorea leprosula]